MRHIAGPRWRIVLAILALALSSGKPAGAAEASDTAAPAPADESAWSLHLQSTAIWQGYPGFHSPVEGKNSLPGGGQARETISGTAFLGRRLPWEGGEL